MILRESKDDQILEYSSNIKSAGNTLLSIINNILDFSKIEDGKMTLVPVEFDVAELINNLLVEADKALRPWWQKIYLKAARRVMVGRKRG